MYMNTEGKHVVLVVDDDANLREILRAKLEAADFVIFEATDGQDAIDKVKKEKPDLVLMDVQMPRMNGITALSKIKADPEIADTKVLFLTNYGEAETADKLLDDKFAKEIGAVGHIRKTDDLEAIIELIKQEVIKK